MKCQVCMLFKDVDCIQTATIIEDDMFIGSHTTTIKRAYYCPRCKARFIVKEELRVHP